MDRFESPTEYVFLKNDKDTLNHGELSNPNEILFLISSKV